MGDPLEHVKAIARRVQDKKKQELTTNSTELVQQDLFREMLTLPDGNPQFPTLFCRVPIFAPVRSRETLDTTWQRSALVETSWGRVERFGPGLDIYDEDTLIALIHLCQQERVRGARSSLPFPVLRLVDDDLGQRAEGHNEEVEVLVGKVTAFEIAKYLGRSTSGASLRSIRTSLQRLSLTQIRIHRDDFAMEGKVGFFDYVADKKDFYGRFLVQFNPAIVRLLGDYTFLRIDIRLQLTDIGKAVHKFLTSQGKNYEISLTKLATVIGSPISTKLFRQRLEPQLKLLQSLGWLKSYAFVGNGRSSPVKLVIER